MKQDGVLMTPFNNRSTLISFLIGRAMSTGGHQTNRKAELSGSYPSGPQHTIPQHFAVFLFLGKSGGSLPVTGRLKTENKGINFRC